MYILKCCAYFGYSVNDQEFGSWIEHTNTTKDEKSIHSHHLTEITLLSFTPSVPM